MMPPWMVMYATRRCRSFKDHRGVPLAEDEVGRARTLVNTMTRQIVEATTNLSGA